MTEKQQHIVSAALELFTQNGYAATSTAKIAKAAGVSEGLIFRHFKNKKGLLDELMCQGNSAYAEEVERVFMINDPEKLIRNFISSTVDLLENPETARYWMTMVKLKQEMGMSNEEKYGPVIDRLGWALGAIGHGNPKAVARCLISAQEGMLAPASQGNLDAVRAIATGMRELVLNE